MAGTAVSFEVVSLEKPEDVNVIVRQAHFIKTVEDLHEALAGVSASLRFGVAFCEASGARLVRRSGNDGELTSLAVRNAEAGAAPVFESTWTAGVHHYIATTRALENALVLEAQARMRQKGLSPEEAEMAAFEENTHDAMRVAGT